MKLISASSLYSFPLFRPRAKLSVARTIGGALLEGLVGDRRDGLEARSPEDMPLGDQHYPVPELPVNLDHYQKQQVGDSLHGVPGVDEDDAGQCRWKNYDPRNFYIATK